MGNSGNRRQFTGVLTILDRPSDRNPSGSRSRRIVLTRKATEAALHTLIGKGVNADSTLRRHNPTRPCGRITGAEIIGDELHVSGYLYEDDFPLIVERIAAEAEDCGMSYEATDCLVRDMRDEVWTIDRFKFTGASILKRDRAAYRQTSITL